jgi:hypothetical protein
VAEAVTRATAYIRRFGLVYFGLAAVVGAAIGGTIILAGRSDRESSPWSDWRPTTPREFQTKAIASRVAAAYRLEDGRQLVDVLTGDPFPSVITEIATPEIGTGFGSKTRIYDPSRTRMFILCGAGKNCSVPGIPSVERTQLLRREALELALYTFKYVDTESVVEFLPGRVKARPNLAFFFRRDELDRFLSQPLRKTLPRNRALFPADVDPIEARRVDGLTLTHLYRFQLQPSQTGGGLLVLDRG